MKSPVATRFGGQRIPWRGSPDNSSTPSLATGADGGVCLALFPAAALEIW
jgi:hypothetical protein